MAIAVPQLANLLRIQQFADLLFHLAILRKPVQMELEYALLIKSNQAVLFADQLKLSVMYKKIAMEFLDTAQPTPSNLTELLVMIATIVHLHLIAPRESVPVLIICAR
jgi:hypothetical protein